MISMSYRGSRGSYWLIAADQRKVLTTKSSIAEENVYILWHSAGGQVLHVSKNKVFDLEKTHPELKKIYNQNQLPIELFQNLIK